MRMNNERSNSMMRHLQTLAGVLLLLRRATFWRVQDLALPRDRQVSLAPRSSPVSSRWASPLYTRSIELQTAMEGVVVGESPSKARKAETLSLLSDLREALQQLEEARKKAEASSGDYAAQLLEQKSRNEALEETSAAQRRGTNEPQALPHVVKARMIRRMLLRPIVISFPQRPSDCRCSSPS